MTLEEISSRYSWKEVGGIPGDGDFRLKLFSPLLKDLCENKIVYYERFMCVAIVEDIKITPELFEITAIPYIKIERSSSLKYYPVKPWTFGAGWCYTAVHKGYFTTYGGAWLFWTDKDLVRSVEELARKGDFETALNLTLYKDRQSTGKERRDNRSVGQSFDGE